jgi:hypothetical protein
MPKNQRLVEESDSEEYLHKAAWQVVTRQIEHAEANLKGSLSDDLVAMVFAYHSLEGYLNFVGEKIAPELWKDERARFSGTGITGKLSVICERCGINVPTKGKRPYATVSELKKLRDRMAHPKTHRARKKVEFAETKPPPLFPKSYLASLVNHQKALRARDDVKRIADEIHSAVVRRFPHARLGPDALCGIHSMRTTSTRLL